MALGGASGYSYASDAGTGALLGSGSPLTCGSLLSITNLSQHLCKQWGSLSIDATLIGPKEIA